MHDTSTRDLGSGARFGADVYELFEAGRVAFPDLASLYTDAADELHQVTHALRGIAGRLGHVGARGVAARAEELYDAAATTSRRLHLTGEALLLLADEFRRTDEEAASTFHRLTVDHRDLLFSSRPWRPPPRLQDVPGCLTHEPGGPDGPDWPDDLPALLEAAGLPSAPTDTEGGA